MKSTLAEFDPCGSLDVIQQSNLEVEVVFMGFLPGAGLCVMREPGMKAKDTRALDTRAENSSA